MESIKSIESIIFINLFRLFKNRETSIVNLERDIDSELNKIVEMAFNKDYVERRYESKSFNECKSTVESMPDLVTITDRIDVLANDPEIVNQLMQVIQYLNEILPRNSIPTLFSADVKEPNLYDKMDYVRTFEALVFPIETFRNVIANETTHKQIDIISQFYPQLLGLLKEKIFDQSLSHTKMITRQQNIHLSQMLQVPRVTPETLKAIHSQPEEGKEESKGVGNINGENMLGSKIQDITAKGV